jgi:dihydrofolate synthase/folylpolyglutamate synthase
MSKSSDEAPDTAGAAAFDPRYLVTLDEIYHAGWAAKKRYRIDLVRQALDHFWPQGHPTSFVHVAGTNGKGSLCHYLEQGFAFAGATGSWTGPHVFDYAERFHVDGEQVSRGEIVDVYRRLLLPYQRQLGFENRGEALSFAELSILLALHLCARHRTAWGMLEVGAGGRYTQLMAIPVRASVVTDVGGDHPLTLGRELWQRALTKAGIAREGVPFFTAARGEALGYVVATAESEGAKVSVLGDEEIDEVGRLFAREAPGHERANLALAVKIIRHFYPEKATPELLESMSRRLPGRFASPEPRVIADVAHNEEKVRALAEQLKLEHPGRRFRFLVGLTRQRDPVAVFRPLFELAEHLTVTSASYAGRDPREIAALLAEAFPAVSSIADPREAFRRERESLAPDQLLVLTGSAYMIDQALNPDPYVRHTNASFGWRTRSPARGS